MTFAHLTSNSTQSNNTFLCPRTLFSSPISSSLGSPQPRETAQLSLFQPPEVYKGPRFSPNHQSHLYCCLDSTSPRIVFTSTSTAASGCSMSRPAEPLPVSPCSCPPRGPQLLPLAGQLTLKIVLASALLTFTQKSPHLSRTCLQMHQWLSLASQLHLSRRANKCTSDFHSQVTSPLRRASKCTSQFHSQVNSSVRRASKCTVDFHSQVTTNVLSKCTPKNVLSKCMVKFVL